MLRDYHHHHFDIVVQISAMTTSIQATIDERVLVSGIDLTEYLLISNQASSFSTPMDRFLEGSGVGRMEKLIVPSTSLGCALRKKNTTKKIPKGSMIAEMSQSSYGTST